MLIRRPFPFYLSSQFTYFINAYYVMVSFNVLIWVCAVFAIRDFLSNHFDDTTASIAALLTASGPGFIMYVAQPQTYLWGYCAVALIIWAHWKICCKTDASLRDYIFFGGILALGLLTYDLFTWLLYLAGYEIVLRKRLRNIAISAALATGVYVAFGLLTSPMTSFVHDKANTKYIGESVTAAVTALRSNPLGLKTYILYSGLLPNYIWNLSNSVFVFPLMGAIIGLFCLRSSIKLKLVGLLFLPSLVGAAFLYLGQTYLSTLPRFSFTAYTAVYVLCAVALSTAARGAGSRWRYAAAAVTIGGIAVHIALANADVFGHPWLYYLFYYEQLRPANF